MRALGGAMKFNTVLYAQSSNIRVTSLIVNVLMTHLKVSMT